MPDNTNTDRTILEAIDAVRIKHDACTAKAVASRTKMSVAYVKNRLLLMRDAGLVTWNAMPGSLRRVSEPRIADEMPVDSVVSDEPKKVGLSTTTKKVAKKTVAKKKPQDISS